MQAPPEAEPPPPPLLVPAARELGRFGSVWLVVAALLALVDLASGSAAELDGPELLLLGAFLGLSTGCVLGALLLARRTSPEILYYRILDHAPPPPPQVPLETSGATTRRVLPPALGLTFGLLVVAFIGVGMTLLMGGEPREEVGEDLAGGTMFVCAGWIFVCGAAGLRMSRYFRHWERLRDAIVLCRPLKAGTMRPVYWVARADD